MGIQERKTREKEQRRHDIIDAAEKVFFSKGLATATMDEVAETAELSKGTLYLYFKSKEELYRAIVLRGMNIMRLAFEEACDVAGTGLDKVKAISRAYHRFYQEYPDYYRALVYREAHDPSPNGENSCELECDEEGSNIINIVVNAIRQGIEDGSIRGDLDPLKTAIVLWGQTMGILQMASLKGPEISEKLGLSPEDLISSHFELMNSLLSGEKK